MVRLRLFALFCALGVLSVGSGVFSQDPKKDKSSKEAKDEDVVKARGQLPANWSKLGLTDEQKQKTYKIRAKYKEQIDEYTAKITKLKDEEKKDLQTVLTDEQKKRLIEIRTGEKAKDDKGKDDKKDKDPKKDKDDKKDK